MGCVWGAKLISLKLGKDKEREKKGKIKFLDKCTNFKSEHF